MVRSVLLSLFPSFILFLHRKQQHIIIAKNEMAGQRFYKTRGELLSLSVPVGVVAVAVAVVVVKTAVETRI